MKSYTDLQQSKKLAEILPIESADIILILENSELTSYPIIRNYSEFYNYLRIFEFEEEHIKRMYIPAWSLAALLDVLNKTAYFINEKGIVEISSFKSIRWCVSILNCGKIVDCYADNQIDACVEMIKKLHELKLL